jgi:hypothetical protein
MPPTDRSQPEGLSADFSRRLEERLFIADRRRQQRAVIRRWRTTAWLALPAICAVCWAVLPVTFGNGIRALIGALGFITMLLSIAQVMSREYLAYLGLGMAPLIVDVLLLVGVASWLMWAARAEGQPVTDPGL